LIDEKGSPHPLLRDCHDRYHLLPTKAISLLPLVPALLDLGVARYRIEGALYEQATLCRLCATWRAALDGSAFQEFATPAEKEGTWLGALGPAAKIPRERR